MTSIVKLDEIQNNAGTTTLAKLENGVLTGVLSPATGFRNRIINGDMRIDQRNVGASVTANSATNPYVTDRWRSLAHTGSGQFSAQQSNTAPSGFTNSLLFTSLAATSVGASDGFGFRQPIEGFNVADLGWGTANAQPITVSFFARSSLTGTFGGAVANNASPNRSYPFTFTITSANTWEYKTITILGDTAGTWATDNTTGINLWFGMGVGATYSGTAGVWSGSDFRSATGATSVVGTNGATFYVTGVQIEKGTVATPFEFRSVGQELGLCYRYYQELREGVSGISQGVTMNFMSLFPVPMRSAPSLSLSAVLRVTDLTTSASTQTSTNIVVYDLSAKGMSVNCGNFSPSLTLNRPVLLTGPLVSGNGSIQASAEL